MLLHAAYLFQDLDEASIEAIARIAVEERCAAGTYLYKAGDPAADLFILFDGRVRVSFSRAGNLSYSISEPGGALGWSGMAGFAAYGGSAECTTPATILRINGQDLARILEDNPLSGMRFYRLLATMIGARLIESYGATLSLQDQKGSGSYG